MMVRWCTSSYTDSNVSHHHKFGNDTIPIQSAYAIFKSIGNWFFWNIWPIANSVPEQLNIDQQDKSDIFFLDQAYAIRLVQEGSKLYNKL